MQSGHGRDRQPTLLGDTVHVAFRLCEATVHQERAILIGGVTQALILDTLPCEPLGQLHVKGRQEMVDLYTPERPAGPP